MAAGRVIALRLYRDLLREGQNFKAYNFREYSLRRIRVGFEENRTVADADKIKQLLSEGEKELLRLKRMTTVNSIYATRSLVIETTKKL